MKKVIHNLKIPKATNYEKFFLKRGFKWLINASNKPYAGAYCIFKGYKMIIWEAKIVDDQENFSAIPGQVTSIKNKIVNVACGKGKISILKIEFKKEITEPSKYIKSLRSRLKWDMVFLVITYELDKKN